MAICYQTFVAQGDYEVELKAKDDDGETLFCMLVDFSIKPLWAHSIRSAHT